MQAVPLCYTLYMILFGNMKFGFLKNKMICFEDNFALLWLYYLKQFFRNRLFFLSCPTIKISRFDFTSPFESWGFSYRGTNLVTWNMRILVSECRSPLEKKDVAPFLYILLALNQLLRFYKIQFGLFHNQFGNVLISRRHLSARTQLFLQFTIY